MTRADVATLQKRFTALRMTTAREVVGEVLTTAYREEWPLEDYTRELLDMELDGRRQRRVERYLKGAHLPPGKTLATFDKRRLNTRLRRQLKELCSGEFVDRTDNALLFGLPGKGKTHFAAAVGHELVHQSRQVLFAPAFKVVDRLQRAKRDLELEGELRRLDRFELIILDDFGYVRQNHHEMEVLFTLLAERYERRSLMITSNLVFSEWDRIFLDPLTTQSAIERVVHHSVIVEFGQDISSYRADAARERQALSEGPSEPGEEAPPEP
jgi:DNA replication protein DnaC